MPGGDGIQVNSVDLVAHAAHTDAVGGALAVAQRAGQVVRLGSGAYGQLCTVLPTLLNGLQEVLVDAVGAASRSAHDTGARLRRAADEYDGADQRATAALDRLRSPP